MRTYFLCTVAIGLGLAANAFAQPAPAPNDVPMKSPEPVGAKIPDLSAAACEPRLWFTADYLLWWTKSAAVPQPLITVGSSGDPIPGALGQPNT